MLIIKSIEEVGAQRAAGTHTEALLDCVERSIRSAISGFGEAGFDWDPDEHGAFVIMEAGDRASDFEQIGLNSESGGLTGACWESCQLHADARVYEILVLYCGDTGWTFFVPTDVGWVDPELRAKLNAEATTPFYQSAVVATLEVPS